MRLQTIAVVILLGGISAHGQKSDTEMFQDAHSVYMQPGSFPRRREASLKSPATIRGTSLRRCTWDRPSSKKRSSPKQSFRMRRFVLLRSPGQS
jgi:hypothetical protein